MRKVPGGATKHGRSKQRQNKRKQKKTKQKAELGGMLSRRTNCGQFGF
jgi:hypothetical protein